MRQSDVRVGEDYAVVEHEHSEAAARIRPTSPAKNGQVEADLLEMPELPQGQRNHALTVKRGGKKCTVPTRRVWGPWEDWIAECDRRVAARHQREEDEAERKREWEKREAEHAAAIEDLTNPDPDRVVPQSYELHWSFGEDSRWDNMSREASGRLGKAASGNDRWVMRQGRELEVAALFKDLPAGLCRDIIAAMGEAGRHRAWVDPKQTRVRVPAGATVAVALDRTAALFRSLVVLDPATPDPDGFFDDADAAFVDAFVEDIESRGHRFALPFVPPLPLLGLDSGWHRDRSERACEVLGWIRLGVAETTGLKLHHPACRHVSPLVPGEHSNTQPWWQVRFSPIRRRCGTCGGPGIVSPLEVAHFAAASDIWAARGGGAIEEWQRVAVVRLLNGTAEVAARKGEGHPSLDALVAAELMKALPGEEGEEAYRLFTMGPYGLFLAHRLDAAAEARALALARERLEVVRSMLPASVELRELPVDVTLEKVRRRYLILRKLVLENCIDKFLFGLPGLE